MIRIASSLTNRIFLASTLLATLSLGFAFVFANVRATKEVEADLQRGLAEAAAMVDQHRATRTDTLTRMARLIADLPVLKAVVDTADAPTVQRFVDETRGQINADLLVVTDAAGKPLGSAGADPASLPILRETPSGADELSTFLPHARGLLHVVSVPILIGPDPPHIFGYLTVGFFMDDALASQFKGLTGSEIAFAANGHVLASSLGRDSRQTLETVLGASEPTTIALAGQEYLALARPMRPGESGAGPITLTLRSRTERLRFLNTLRASLVGALIVTILLATILSYAVARTVTRPLSTVTGAMRDVAATGDLSRKVLVRSRAWDDEDARLLASAFNTLTESIARFQREAGQKERLSSLGRLSTVIAHEIRNPLMIIRTTLAALRRDHVSAADRREAAADIDEETTRLNRLVTDVLDFAKPVRFELAPADLNEVCRASTSAAWAGEEEAQVQLDLDPRMPTAVTDAERLRTALVNILTNARNAVHAATATQAGGTDAPGRARGTVAPRRDTNGARRGVAVASQPGVIVSTRHQGSRATVTVRDHGAGIAPDDMVQIFDPYFTTRRKGTGLGLPIAKNIIEGLGGTIAVTSRLGEGTEIRIDLPLTSPEGPS